MRTKIIGANDERVCAVLAGSGLKKEAANEAALPVLLFQRFLSRV